MVVVIIVVIVVFMIIIIIMMKKKEVACFVLSARLDGHFAISSQVSHFTIAPVIRVLQFPCHLDFCPAPPSSLLPLVSLTMRDENYFYHRTVASDWQA